METLGLYFSYNNDTDDTRNTFINLYQQLKKIHEDGFAVADISAQSIVHDQDGFKFSRFDKLDEDKKRDNIESLCKLAVGTYFSLPTGTFFDYSHFPTSYVKDNFEIMATSLPDSDYYRDVLVNGHIWYYNDYLKEVSKKADQGKGNSNARVLGYSTPEGRAMTNKQDEAAFINIVFYPILVTLAVVLGYMVYILFK